MLSGSHAAGTPMPGDNMVFILRNGEDLKVPLPAGYGARHGLTRHPQCPSHYHLEDPARSKTLELALRRAWHRHGWTLCGSTSRSGLILEKHSEKQPLSFDTWWL